MWICCTGVILISVFSQWMSAIISYIFYISKLNFWKCSIGLALCSPVKQCVLVRRSPFWVILKSTYLHKECTDKKKSRSCSRSHAKWLGHTQRCLGYMMHPNYKLPSTFIVANKQQWADVLENGTNHKLILRAWSTYYYWNENRSTYKSLALKKYIHIHKTHVDIPVIFLPI